MSISDKINDIIGIKESFELPDKLLEILLNKDKKREIFNKFLNYHNPKKWNKGDLILYNQTLFLENH